MAENRSSLSSHLSNPLLVLAVGLVFARSFDPPALPARPGRAEMLPAEKVGDATDALLTHDPFRAFPGGNSDMVGGCDTLEFDKGSATLVLACLVRGGPWPEDRERRIEARTAVVRGIMDSGYVADKSRQLRFFRKDDWVLPYDTFSGSEGKTPYKCIATLWVDELRLRDAPYDEFVGLLGKLSLGSGCTLKILGPSSSGGLARWLESAEQSSSRTPLHLYSPFSTVGSLRFTKWNSCAGSLLVEHRIGTDEELAKLLVMELRERIPTLMSFGRAQARRDEPFHWFHGLPQQAVTLLKMVRFIPELEEGQRARVVLLCESDSLYGRQWTQNLIDAWKELHGEKSPLGDIAFETYPYITVVDGKGLTSEENESKERSVSQIDYIRRIADALDEGRPVDAIGILGSDTHDILQLLGTLRSRFPAAVFFTTDMNAKYLDPEHMPYTRNLIVASHGELSVGREGPPPTGSSGEQPGPVHFRDAYQVSVYRTASELAREQLPESWKAEPPRLYEIGAGRAVPLNVPGTNVLDPVDPKQVYLARLADRVPWLSPSSLRVAVGCASALLALWIVFRGFQLLSPRRWLKSVWWPLALLVIGLQRSVSAGSGGEGLQQFEVAASFAFLLAAACLLPRRGPGILAVVLMFLLMRPGASADRPPLEGAVFLPLWSVVFLSGLFLVAARHPARRTEPLAQDRLFLWLHRGLIVAVLAVLFLRTVMGLVEAAHLSASEPVDAFVGVSVWPTVVLRVIGILACVFGVLHIRSRLVRDHEAIGARLRGKGEAPAALSLSELAFWLLDLPTQANRDGHELDAVWEGLGKALKNRLWLAVRLTAYVFIYFLSLAPLFARFPVSAPVRGELSYLCERVSIFLLVIAFLTLFFFVFESSYLALRVAARLRDESTRLPKTERGDALTGRLIRLEFIERITRRCDRMVLWPVSVAALMALSRSSVFDRWCWPASLVLTFVIFFSLLALCALNSQRLASGERRAVQLAMLKMKTGGTDDESHRRRLQERLDRLRSGAFQPFYRHPLLRSLGLPAAAVVVTKALEMGWISI